MDLFDVFHEECFLDKNGRINRHSDEAYLSDVTARRQTICASVLRVFWAKRGIFGPRLPTTKNHVKVEVSETHFRVAPAASSTSQTSNANLFGKKSA
jgi:hypothetical protein